MTVYADILILTNFLVDYFLISFSCNLLHQKPRLFRLLLSAGVGSIFSLYIFLPQTNFAFQIIIHILMCSVLCFVCLGFGSIKSFVRSVATLFCVNFAYSGAMIAIWLVFKPYGMVINNSMVYFNISPMFFILFSVVGYFGVIIIRKITKRSFFANTYCQARLCCGDLELSLPGIVDTGNSLVDLFGLSQILITDSDTVRKILGDEFFNPTRFRKIPCGTVTGQKLLDGYRIDSAVVNFNNKNYHFKSPILAVSAIQIIDAKIIVNPENLN